jgi:hypothetical protein
MTEKNNRLMWIMVPYFALLVSGLLLLLAHLLPSYWRLATAGLAILVSIPGLYIVLRATGPGGPYCITGIPLLLGFFCLDVRALNLIVRVLLSALRR